MVARLYVLRCCNAPNQKNKLYVLKVILKKIKNAKISNPFCSIVDKKQHKETKTDYTIFSKNVATLLAVLLLSQHSHQIKNKHKKLLNSWNFKLVLIKAVFALGCPLFWHFEKFHRWPFQMASFNEKMIWIKFLKMKFRGGAKSFKFECGFLCWNTTTIYSRALLLHCGFNTLSDSVH